ncbi:unnamed protein product [Cyprideis torosa]|uniref:Uncharacterized protein n=1 Tax=Cyprideis torosa TaxID=163714 RepID=A0A7R8WMD6_9CRUS|nr:unnamed protein product [Cyprideis torosa]CAG0899195.1 unnamed protein product [Cyprideis torosa]
MANAVNIHGLLCNMVLESHGADLLLTYSKTGSTSKVADVISVFSPLDFLPLCDEDDEIAIRQHLSSCLVCGLRRKASSEIRGSTWMQGITRMRIRKTHKPYLLFDQQVLPQPITNTVERHLKYGAQRGCKE